MKPSGRILIAGLVVATLFKLYLAQNTDGSLDAAGFLDHLHKIREFGVQAYRVRGAFNNPFNSPPAMIHLIKLWGWLADQTTVRFQFWVRLPSILADIGSFLVVSKYLRRLWPQKKSFGVLLALALCPTAVLISGYHGNTDSLMIFLVLLSIYLVEIGRTRWLAGLVFGLALCVKVMPLCFVPVMFFFLEGWRERATFFGSGALTLTVCSLPYFLQDPKAISDTVLGYTSIYGHWGWSLIASLTFPEPPVYLHKPFDVQGTHATFAQILKYISIALILTVSIWLNRRPKPSLFLQTGLITSIVLFMTPGFGIQYLVWLVPFVVLLGLRLTLLYYSLSAAYLLSVYACFQFSACLPPVILVLLSLCCWLTMPVLIVAYRRLLGSVSHAHGDGLSAISLGT